MTYADAGKYRKAVKSLRRSLELAQPHESHVRKIYALLVSSYREQNQKAEARQACTDGLKFYPKDPELLFRNAMLLHQALLLARRQAHSRNLHVDEGVPGSLRVSC
jgi:tetratricopeptide (TPR) repeat protein